MGQGGLERNDGFAVTDRDECWETAHVPASARRSQGENQSKVKHHLDNRDKKTEVKHHVTLISRTACVEGTLRGRHVETSSGQPGYRAAKYVSLTINLSLRTQFKKI